MSPIDPRLESNAIAIGLERIITIGGPLGQDCHEKNVPIRFGPGRGGYTGNDLAFPPRRVWRPGRLRRD